MSYSELGSNIIEPELLGPIPRKAGFVSNLQAMQLRQLLFVLGVMGFVMLTHSGNLQDLIALRTHGVRTLAIVTGTRKETDKDGTYYFVDYSFTAGGIKVAGQEPVSSTVYAHTSAGYTQVVTYLPENPHMQRPGIVDDSVIINEQWSNIMFLVIIVIIVRFAFAKSKDDIRLQLWLLQIGTPVVGQISDRNHSWGTGSRQYYVTYQFLCPTGTVEAEIMVSRGGYMELVPGTTLTVLYNPANPNENKLYRYMSAVTLG
jgi:hypothetical protein